MAGKRKKKAAKKPPPPKRKAKRTPFQKKGKKAPGGNKPVKTRLEFEDEHGDPQAWVYLRYAAGRHYSTDLNGCSLAELHRMPLFSIVPIATITYWCSQDGWVERRRGFIEELRRKTEERVGTALVQARIEQLKRSQNILDQASDLILTKAKAKMLEANSLEGMINAYVRMAQMVDDQREKLADAVLPEPMAVQQPMAGQLPTVRPRLSEGEARAAALTIVRMRREEIRSALRAEETEKEEAEQPHMRIIDGEK